MSASTRKIPSPVISVLSEAMAELETHDSIDNIFLYAEAPDDIPEGAKRAKVTAWLRNVNKVSPSPLSVLGLIVESYMEYIEPEPVIPVFGQIIENSHLKLQKQLSKTFERFQLSYTSEGVIIDLLDPTKEVQLPKPTHTITHHISNTSSNIYQSKTTKKNKIFIVHGRDNEAKQEISRYVESLGIGVIILHEQASIGMTIIEKIEHYANEADFALILYTECDHGRGAHETKIKPKNRARQNVVFEHGYLMAKLGRENVCALVKGDVETPNDISGVVYVGLDSLGAWKQAVNKELKACNYNINCA